MAGVCLLVLFLSQNVQGQTEKPRANPLDFSVLYPPKPAPAALEPLLAGAFTVNFAGSGFVPTDFQMLKDPYWGYAGAEVANYLSDTDPHFKTIYADQPLNLPVGARIGRVSGVVVDHHSNWDAIVAVNSTDLGGRDFKSCYAYTVATTDAEYFEIAASCEMTVERDRIYTARIVLPPAGPNLRIASLSVHYTVSIAPPPSQQTFTDVPPTDPYYAAIEAMSKSGLTAGCGGGNFCPDAPLTRRQLAIFLSKALGLGW